MPDPKRVLILCTGNSCRSQMAEQLWNQLAGGSWLAQSAGSNPAGYVHEMAKEVLKELGLATDQLTSKSSDLFVDQPFDLVVTVCDNAQKSCPVWPCAQKTLHWPFSDPAEATGTPDERLLVFRHIRDQIQMRIAEYLDQE